MDYKTQSSSLMKPKLRSALLILAINCGIVMLSLYASINTAYSQSPTQESIGNNSPQSAEEFDENLDKWMLRAYEGEREAQFQVAMLFSSQFLEQADYEQAIYWYTQAARQGHVLAQYNLGHLYISGNGVDKNNEAAMQWWLKAAKNNHPLAQFNIGRAFYLGLGLEENHAKSKYWFQRAAENKEPKSIDILKQIKWDNNDAISPASADKKLSPKQASISSIIDSANHSRTSDTVNDETNALNTQQKTDTPQSGEPSKQTDNSIALYTNPKVRSVLITIVQSKDDLALVDKNGDWSVITSKKGFPVWVHKDLVSSNKNNVAKVTSSSVNARSVPIITKGTVVGKLNRGDSLKVIDQQEDWYRVLAPTRFKAWVKTDDYERINKPAINTANNKNMPADKPVAPPNKGERTFGQATHNDNEWLFKQSPKNYTLQLASFDNQESVSLFLAQSKFSSDTALHRFTAVNGDIQWTYFLYGSYSDKPAAKQIKNKLHQQQAWIRTFGMIQQNRCVAWKTQLPTPSELNKYCTQ